MTSILEIIREGLGVEVNEEFSRKDVYTKGEITTFKFVVINYMLHLVKFRYKWDLMSSDEIGEFVLNINNINKLNCKYYK